MRTRVIVGLLVICALAGPARPGDGPRAGGSADREAPRLVAQVGPAGPIISASISPDGRWVFLGGVDGVGRLWDVETAREVRRFSGHTGDLRSATFALDGRHLLTGSVDRTVRLWEVHSGREVRRIDGWPEAVYALALSPDGRRVAVACGNTVHLLDAESFEEVRGFEGHRGLVASVSYSPEGRFLLTGSADGTARIWEVETGREAWRLEGHTRVVVATAWSPDGRWVLTGSEDTVARVWDAETGREIRNLPGNGGVVFGVAISPDGQRAVTAGADNLVHLWDTATGEEIRRFEGHTLPVYPVAFSADGRTVLSGSFDRTARLWDVETGREIRCFAGRADWVFAAAFSPDGRRIVTGGEDRVVRLWSAETGHMSRALGRHEGRVWTVAFSPDGREVLTGSADRTARLWDVGTGREIRRFEDHLDAVRAAFSPDGGSVVTGSADRTARLCDAATGREIRRFEGHTDAVLSAAVSSDGRWVLTGSADRTARLWDAATGKEVRRLEGHADSARAAFSPDGLFVLTVSVPGVAYRWYAGDREMCARLWEADTGKELRRFEGHTEPVLHAGFSPDGRWVLTGSADTTAGIWDPGTGRRLRSLMGHSSNVYGATCSPDMRWILTASSDCTTRVWDAESGQEVCQLIGFVDGSWAVVDPAGRFDASNAGDVEGLHWVVGDEPIALSQLKDRYYDPGLLAKHMGFNAEPLREVAAFDAPRLFPKAEVEAPTADDSHLRIRLSDQGGGIGKVVVLVNGKEVTADARGGAVAPDAKVAVLSLDLAGDPRLKPGEENTIEVFAYNAEGYLRSRGLRVAYTPAGEVERPTPSLWAIVCGVSDYRGDAIDLRYAGKDAADFATALKLAAEGLLGAEKVHVSLLVTEPVKGATRPTRENLAKAFESARAASPDDLLVVYLSGHGVNWGGQDGDFHYLLADAAGTDLTDPEVRRQATVSSAELTEWIKAIPATKRQVLILDTCASGKVIEKLTERREVPGSQVRALDRLKDRTGVFVLAGCAADQVSYEASRYGQGLLTYSLLLGMRGAALREESYVDVGLLFAFAADTVPGLAKDIGGIQRPVLAQPKGGASFDIGRLSPEERAQVPLQEAKPVFVRPSVQEELRPRDALGLGAAVEEALRAAPTLIFVDVREVPGAYEIAGRYVTKDGIVTVTAGLYQGQRQIAAFTVEGPEADADSLATKIVGAAMQFILK